MRKLNNEGHVEIKYRSMLPEDVNEIIEVHRKSIYGLCNDFYDDKQRLIWSDTFKDRFKEGLKNANNTGIVAVFAGKVIGYGFINLHEKEVGGMYLIPEFAGCGIGRRILTELESIARQEQLGELRLNSTLNAVTFYEKCGYVRIRDELFILTESCKLRCVHMAKRICL